MWLINGERFTHEACQQLEHSAAAVASGTIGRGRVNPRILNINPDDLGVFFICGFCSLIHKSVNVGSVDYRV